MKKTGFTLAEVLIALTVVGVLVAMTIPTFTANIHNNAYAAQMASKKSDIENAIKSMIIQEDANDISETAFGEALAVDNTNGMLTELGKYLKLDVSVSDLRDLGYLAFLQKGSIFIPCAMAKPLRSCQEECGFDDKCLRNCNAMANDGNIDTTTYTPLGDDNDNNDIVPGNGNDNGNGNGNDNGNDNGNGNGNGNENGNGSDNGGNGGNGGNGNGAIGFGRRTTGNNFTTITGGNTSINYDAAITSAGDGGVMLFGYNNGYTQAINGGTDPANAAFATLAIDVNGNSTPNKLGRDVFAFVISGSGALHPYGSESASRLLGVNGTPTWRSNDATYGCSQGNYSGIGCTHRLIEDGFKVKY